MKKIIIIILVIVFVGAGYLVFLYSQDNISDNQTANWMTPADPTILNEPKPLGVGESGAEGQTEADPSLEEQERQNAESQRLIEGRDVTN